MWPLYTHLGFSLLFLNASSGFKCPKKKQISSNTSEQNRESRERERERERGRRESRERERAGERKDGWEIERVRGLGYWIPEIGTMWKSVKVERFKGFFFRCHALQQMENMVVFCMDNLQ